MRATCALNTGLVIGIRPKITPAGLATSVTPTPLQRGAVERSRGENRHICHCDSSSFEDGRMLSTVALVTCPSGTCVSVALLIASASSPLPRC